jgi:site-specific DNA-methyltransferase (adenine-specific)
MIVCVLDTILVCVMYVNNETGVIQPIKEIGSIAHEKGALPRDVIKIPALAGGAGMKERVNHPTQKPLALCDKLIKSCKQSSSDGYVLVPFAGSGSECLAAKNNNLPFIGIELNAEYIKIINERLNIV